MIDTIGNLLFRCAHRRLTRPITPMSKPGVPQGETYVVCLDCGKQFAYDWDTMRIGKAIESSRSAGVLDPAMPGRQNRTLRYALLAASVPLGFLLGKALMQKPEARSEKPEEKQ